MSNDENELESDEAKGKEDSQYKITTKFDLMIKEKGKTNITRGLRMLIPLAQALADPQIKADGDGGQDLC